MYGAEFSLLVKAATATLPVPAHDDIADAAGIYGYVGESFANPVRGKRPVR